MSQHNTIYHHTNHSNPGIQPPQNLTKLVIHALIERPPRIQTQRLQYSIHIRSRTEIQNIPHYLSIHTPFFITKIQQPSQYHPTIFTRYILSIHTFQQTHPNINTQELNNSSPPLFGTRSKLATKYIRKRRIRRKIIKPRYDKLLLIIYFRKLIHGNLIFQEI